MSDALPTVIVPVHNALDALDTCLASLDRTLPAGSAVLVADDASSDPRIAPMLAGWAERTPLAARVVRRAANLGFPGNCLKSRCNASAQSLISFVKSRP